jgi:hypothetical protein
VRGQRQTESVATIRFDLSRIGSPPQSSIFIGTAADPQSIKASSRLDAEIADLNAKEAQAAGEDASPVSPFRVHDFRRTMATGLQRLGFRWEVIEACENRISGQARKGAGSIYQRHDWGPEKIRAWQAWAAQVDQLATRSDASNVVRLSGVGCRLSGRGNWRE